MGQINDASHAAYHGTVAYKTHQSNLWTAAIDGISVGSGAVYYYGMQIGATPIEMLSFLLTTESEESIIEFFETSAYSGGTQLPAWAMNRANPVALPAADAKYGVTLVTLGNLILRISLRNPTGGGPKDFNITSVLRDAILLMKPTETYLLRITNVATGTSVYDAVWTLSTHDY